MRTLHNITITAALVIGLVSTTMVVFDSVRDRDVVDVQAIDAATTGLQFVGAASPGVSGSDRANIYYDTTADTLQISLNAAAFGTLLSSSSTGDVTITGEYAGGDGSVTDPTYGFTSGGANDGMFLVDTDTVGLVVDAATRLNINSTDISTPSGVNMISLGGDSATTPNFQVESGEGTYDCGTNCVAMAANAIDVFNADATDTLIAQDDTVETITDTGTNGSFAWALDGTLRLTLQTGGHLTSGATATADSGSGTCTAVTVAGNDVRGTITATCTIGQTVIMNFGTAYVAAPICTIAPADADAASAGAFATTSTTAMTVTASVGSAGSQILKYVCIE